MADSHPVREPGTSHGVPMGRTVDCRGCPVPLLQRPSGPNRVDVHRFQFLLHIFLPPRILAD